MATSTFDRELKITKTEDVKLFIEYLKSEPPTEPLSTHPYDSEARKRSEQLLDQYLSHSKL